MFIDSHAHLFFNNFQLDFDTKESKYDNLEQAFEAVLQRAKQAGVTHIVNIGVDIERSKLALDQAISPIPEKVGIQLFSTIGIHPDDVEAYIAHPERIAEDLDELEKISQSYPSKVVGVGECGLDYYFPSGQGKEGFLETDLDDIKDAQRKVLIAQRDLALKLDLPLIIHCREAWQDIFPYVEHVEKGVFHCYSGDEHITEIVLKETNFYLSYACNITYPKNEVLRSTVKMAPLDRIVIETDCPFLAPQKLRGKTNEPANVLEAAKCIAEIKGITVEEVGRQTSKNATELFSLAG